jgi:single-strand DNA-binding protein
MANFNLNKVILGGRISSDIELKQNPEGLSVLTFTIAVNRKHKSGEDTKADFIRIVAWRNNAEFISKYFNKGSSICVSGAIQQRKWTDNDNKEHYVFEVVADEVFFVDKKSESVSESTPSASPYNPYIEKEDDTPKFEEINKDDDLPF